ncbi:MAG: hypothetical protein NT154_05755, partial [Verrucomicrobia bacterium]|nr:hypothetical protein [Verrucomicrobiota bacterium]
PTAPASQPKTAQSKPVAIPICSSSKPPTAPQMQEASQTRGEVDLDALEARMAAAGVLTVTVWDWGQSKNVAEVELTSAEFSRIKKAIAGTSDDPVEHRALSHFVQEALLKHGNRMLFPGTPMNELDQAICQADALLRLALEHQGYKEEEESGNDYGRQCFVGLVALYHSTSDRLRAAFNAAFSYAHGESESSMTIGRGA